MAPERIVYVEKARGPVGCLSGLGLILLIGLGVWFFTPDSEQSKTDAVCVAAAVKLSRATPGTTVRYQMAGLRMIDGIYKCPMRATVGNAEIVNVRKTCSDLSSTACVAVVDDPIDKRSR